VTAWDVATTGGKLTPFDVAAATGIDKMMTGLAGYDLTTFREKCTAAGSTICKTDEYKDFSGWSVNARFVTKS